MIHSYPLVLLRQTNTLSLIVILIEYDSLIGAVLLNALDTLSLIVFLKKHGALFSFTVL